MTGTSIKAENAHAAKMWDLGSEGYDNLSRAFADAIEHCILRLDPNRGARILDIGTGTGWTARRLAQLHANVTGIDIGSSLIERAKVLAQAQGLEIDFQVGDVEGLNFSDASFTSIISTFGLMFVNQPAKACQEVSRVLQPGGRMSFLAWKPDSTVAQLTKMMAKYVPGPKAAAPVNPFAWGNPEYVRELFGPDFDLAFENGINFLRGKSSEDLLDLFAKAYGPAKGLLSILDKDNVEALKQEFVRFHNGFKTDLGISMPREYLLCIGIRK